MKLKRIQKKMNYLSFLILLVGILFISGCVSQNGGENVTNQSSPEVVVQPTQGLQIVLKDPGMPEIKYLQPTIKEVQLQNEDGKWITIWSNPEGKAVKLTPDGAENVLDTVNVEAGTYIATRLLVSTIDVEADINRDGDTLDKNVEIILTLEEFNKLPQPERPSAPQGLESSPTKPEQPPTPDKPDKPSEPLSGDTPKDDITGGAVASDNPQGGDNPIGEEPSEPSKPSEPEEPSQPSEPTAPSMSGEPSQPSEPTAPSEPEPCYKIVNGLVYMGGCELGVLDEVHTATPPYNDGIEEHYSPEGYIFPLFEDKFVYGGSGGKIIYDFTLHPLKPKHEQISVEVSTTT